MPKAPEQPRRLRLADVIAEQRATITALLARGGGEHSSVVLTRNSKGDVQIEVTVRTDEYVVPTADAAYAKAAELFDAADAAYPYSSTTTANGTARTERGVVTP
jgi:hypothetical protein